MDTQQGPGPVQTASTTLGVATGVCLVAAVACWFLGERTEQERADAVREARVAAEQAVVPVLSYDHRDLEAGRREARGHLTARYREEYDATFRLVADHAPAAGTVVRARSVSSAVVRPGEDRVQVLVLVDQSTTTDRTVEPVLHQDQVTVTMQQVGGEWLVDDLATQGPNEVGPHEGCLPAPVWSISWPPAGRSGRCA